MDPNRSPSPVAAPETKEAGDGDGMMKKGIAPHSAFFFHFSNWPISR